MKKFAHSALVPWHYDNYTWCKFSYSFFEIQVGGNRHTYTWYKSSFPTYCIRDITCAFYIGFATFLPNLVKIGQILLNRQQFIEIQNGVGRHIDFWQLNQFLYNRGALWIAFVTFPPSLTRIGRKVYKQHRFVEIQDICWRRPPSWLFVTVCSSMRDDGTIVEFDTDNMRKDGHQTLVYIYIAI